MEKKFLKWNYGSYQLKVNKKPDCEIENSKTVLNSKINIVNFKEKK